MSTTAHRSPPHIEKLTEKSEEFEESLQCLTDAFFTSDLIAAASQSALDILRGYALDILGRGGTLFGAREAPGRPIVGAALLSNADSEANGGDEIQLSILRGCFDGDTGALNKYTSVPMDMLSAVGVSPSAWGEGYGSALVSACLAESRARSHNLGLEATVGPDRSDESWLFSVCRTVGEVVGITALASHDTWYGSVLWYMGHTLGLTESPEEIEAAEKKGKRLLRFYSQPKFDLMCPTTVPDDTGSVYFFSKPLDMEKREASSVASAGRSDAEKKTLGPDVSAD